MCGILYDSVVPHFAWALNAGLNWYANTNMTSRFYWLSSPLYIQLFPILSCTVACWKPFLGTCPERDPGSNVENAVKHSWMKVEKAASHFEQCTVLCWNLGSFDLVVLEAVRAEIQVDAWILTLRVSVSSKEPRCLEFDFHRVLGVHVNSSPTVLKFKFLLLGVWFQDLSYCLCQSESLQSRNIKLKHLASCKRFIS